MGMESMPSPEEVAQIQKERTISDAELLKNGGEYVYDGKNLHIELSQEQIQKIKEEHEKGEMAPDLATFIRRHKEVVLSNDLTEMNSAMMEEAMKNIGGTFYLEDIDNMYYFDKDGAVAKIPVSFEIKSIKESPSLKHGAKIKKDELGVWYEQLENLGFRSLQAKSEYYKELGRKRANQESVSPTLRNSQDFIDKQASAALREDIKRMVDEKTERLKKEAQARKTKEFNF